jgi:hypothetical protein
MRISIVCRSCVRRLRPIRICWYESCVSWALIVVGIALLLSRRRASQKHSHAEHGNDKMNAECPSVISTQSVETIYFRLDLIGFYYV